MVGPRNESPRPDVDLVTRQLRARGGPARVAISWSVVWIQHEGTAISLQVNYACVPVGGEGIVLEHGLALQRVDRESIAMRVHRADGDARGELHGLRGPVHGQRAMRVELIRTRSVDAGCSVHDFLERQARFGRLRLAHEPESDGHGGPNPLFYGRVAVDVHLRLLAARAVHRGLRAGHLRDDRLTLLGGEEVVDDYDALSASEPPCGRVPSMTRTAGNRSLERGLHQRRLVHLVRLNGSAEGSESVLPRRLQPARVAVSAHSLAVVVCHRAEGWTAHRGALAEVLRVAEHVRVPREVNVDGRRQRGAASSHRHLHKALVPRSRGEEKRVVVVRRTRDLPQKGRVSPDRRD